VELTVATGPFQQQRSDWHAPKLLRTTRLRADTTVVPADVAYPTDSGLLAKAVRRIAVTGRRIQAAGGATRTRLRDRAAAKTSCPADGTRSRSSGRVGRGTCPLGTHVLTIDLT